MKFTIFIVLTLASLNGLYAQNLKIQQGLLVKANSNIRLGNVWVLNKRNLTKVKSNTTGVFNIMALAGDTLLFSSDNYQTSSIIVTDFTDKIIYMEPVIQLQEVFVKENSIKNDIKEVQRRYKEKSVFYTGTPHYYYLVLKPMTFIYENFKSEVRDARRFNRYAGRELASYKVTERFNDAAIKKTIPIKDSALEDFELTYMPTLKQINAWSDYDLIDYIKSSYITFKKKNQEKSLRSCL